MKTRWIALAGVTALVAIAAAQSPTLRLRLNQGQTVTYVTTTTSEQGGQKSTTTVTQVMKVEKKTGNNMTISTTIQDIKGQNLGPAAQMKGAKYTNDFTDRGVSSNMKVTNGNPQIVQALQMSGGSQLGFMGIIYPAGAVKVGTTWTEHLDLGKMLGSIPNATVEGKIPIVYKVAKIGKEGGKDIVTMDVTSNGTVKMTMSMPAQQGGQSQRTTINIGIKGGGTAKVDAATGLVVSSTSNMTQTINFGGQAQQTTTKSTTTLK
ncbi:MAG: hypothetical protein ACK4XJ_06515 [Fimbriimonadaceae bacterium]